jgi:hypothetical protein
LTHAPIIRFGHLTEVQKRAYVIADNKLAEQAGWDREILAIELGELIDLMPAVGFDVSLTGFEAPEIDLLLADMAPSRPEAEDILPALPRNPQRDSISTSMTSSSLAAPGDPREGSKTASHGLRCHAEPENAPTKIRRDPPHGSKSPAQSVDLPGRSGPFVVRSMRPVPRRLLPKHAACGAALLAQRHDLFRDFGARAVGRGCLGIALVEPPQRHRYSSLICFEVPRRLSSAKVESVSGADIGPWKPLSSLRSSTGSKRRGLRDNLKSPV